MLGAVLAGTRETVGGCLSALDGAGDEAGDFLRRGLGNRLVGDLGAAAQDGDAVADGKQVGHAVADQNDGVIGALQAADQIQHFGDLADADGCGRFIHQHEFGVR